jgi:uncharacterized protein (TIGR00299 family) protein
VSSVDVSSVDVTGSDGTGADGTVARVTDSGMAGAGVTEPENPAVARPAFIDATSGVAGDMLLGALVDAGVPLADLQAAVDAVLPGAVRLTAAEVRRAGQRAIKVDVEVLVADPPHRTWATIRELLTGSTSPAAVRDRALAVFERLAIAEGRVHGIDPADVHFHEVGALDAIADVVGVCAGFVALGLDPLTVSRVSVGSGRIGVDHGNLPVPAPAVLALSVGWPVQAGGTGELATPTGMALVTTLAAASSDLPALTPVAIGIGAGTRDTHGRPNVVRLIVGAAETVEAGGVLGGGPVIEDLVLLECNVDDLDPRLWPDLLTRLLASGANDAWLTPILMKKGRPAHILAVLGGPSEVDQLRTEIFAHSTTLGIRESAARRYSLPRTSRVVTTSGGPVRIKLGLLDGRIVRATPEFEDVKAAAGAAGERPVADLMAEAIATAHAAGLVPGAQVPPDTSGPDFHPGHG